MCKVHQAVEAYLETRRMTCAGQVPSVAVPQARQLILLAVAVGRPA